MSIKNDSAGGGWSGPFGDLLRLQTEFQARLGEETTRYLRRLQGALGPASPGTIVIADGVPDLAASGAPGARVALTLELENLQRVHAVVAPQITPLVSDTGTTWFPSADAGAAFRILSPGAVDSLVIELDVPKALPPGTYRGALLLVGFRESALPVAVRVGDTSRTAETPAAAGTPRPKAPRRKPRRKTS
jgi:hypothetical protein